MFATIAADVLLTKDMILYMNIVVFDGAPFMNRDCLNQHPD